MARTPNTETAGDEAKPLKRYKITIHSEGEGGDKGDVVIGHNFKLTVIQRDKEVEIDEHVLSVLKGSVIDTMVKGDYGKMHPVKVPRYNYTAEPV